MSFHDHRLVGKLKHSLEQQRYLTTQTYDLLEKDAAAHLRFKLMARFRSAPPAQESMKWQARGGKFNITRRSLLKGFAASAVVAIAASFPGTVNAAPLQVQEIMMADRDMICIEVRDSSISQFPMVESTPPAGATVTDIQTNPSGGFRLSLSTATATTYARMLAIHGVTNVGGLVCLEFGAGLLTGMGITTGASMMVNNMTGAHDIENTWTVTVTDSTHVTLNGSSYATLGASGYTNGGYVGGGWSGGTSILANTRMHIRGVAGTLGDELNAQWFWGAVWDSSTLDIANFWAWNAKYGFGSAATYNTWGVPQKANVYTSGGTVSVGGFMTATNPFNGTPGWTALRIGRNNNFIRFDNYTANLNYLDRAAADNVANWPEISGLIVQAVYRKSMPHQQQTNLFGRLSQFRHYLFLKLSGSLPQAAHSIDLTFLGLGVQNFTFDDKTTRSVALHTSQAGFRPGDTHKRCKVSLWVPGYATEGAMDYSWAVGTNAAHLINATTKAVVHTTDLTLRCSPTDLDWTKIFWFGNMNDGIGNVTAISSGAGGVIRLTIQDRPRNCVLRSGMKVLLYAQGATSVGVPGTQGHHIVNRISNTEFDLQGTTFSGAWNNAPIGIVMGIPYDSTTQAQIAVTNIDITQIPCRVTAPGHGLSSGDLFRLGYIGANKSITPLTARGPTWLEHAGNTSNIRGVFTALVIDSDTVDLLDSDAVAVNASEKANPWQSGQTAKIIRINLAGTHGTYVYDIDAPGFTTPGTYRWYVPGLGVSDAFSINDNVYYNMASVMARGEYHQRIGCPIDGRFNTTYPYMTYADGVDGCKVFRSNLPAAFSSQNGSISTNGTGLEWPRQGAAGSPPWITKMRINVRGAHMDAADLDSYALQHLMATCMDPMDVWEWCLAARNTSFNLPSPESYLGSFWNGTAAKLGDLLRSAIHALDVYRQSQDASGMCISGQWASSDPTYGDVGNFPFEPSFIASGTNIAAAGDHLSNYICAANFAKMSSCLTKADCPVQAAAFESAAILAWNRSEEIYWSAPNTGGARDVYYKTDLGMQAATQWTDDQYKKLQDSMDVTISGVLNGASAPSAQNYSYRAMAAACLFRLTNDIAYQDAFVASYPSGVGLINEAARAMWEMYMAPHSGAGTTMVNANDFQWDNAYGAIRASMEGTNYLGNPVSPKAYDNIQSALSPANFGYSGTTLLGDGWMCVHLHMRSFIKTGTYDPAPLKWLVGGMAFNHGANPAGQSLTVGIGTRYVVGQLHNNRKEYGDGIVPDGTGTFYLQGWLGYAFGAVVFNYSNGPLVQTVDLPDITGTADAVNDVHKTFTPYRHSWPLYEPPVEASLIIHCMEFTIGGTEVPKYTIAMYLSAWDGNDPLGGAPTGTDPVPGWRPRFGSNDNHVLIDRRAA